MASNLRVSIYIHPHFSDTLLTTPNAVTSSPCETEQALNVQGTPTKTR